MIKIQGQDQTNLPITSENNHKLGEPLCKNPLRLRSAVWKHKSLMNSHTNSRVLNTQGITEIENSLLQVEKKEIIDPVWSWKGSWMSLGFKNFSQILLYYFTGLSVL